MRGADHRLTRRQACGCLPLVTWGTCAARGLTSATFPPSPLPHNTMAKGLSCAWCGERAGDSTDGRFQVRGAHSCAAVQA